MAHPGTRLLSVMLVVVAAGCAGPKSDGSAAAPAQTVDSQDVEVRWCERRDATSFACAQVLLSASRFCHNPTCNGLCFETGEGRRCLQYDLVRVADAPLARPDPLGRCGVWCGDRDGDRRYDRCLERLTCPERHAELDFSSHYAVRHPLALYETLCAPMPEKVLAHLEAARSGAGDCGATPLSWVVAPATMTHASDSTGPGLCYGVVEDEGEATDEESCGTHHCQTLRYCDGREKAQHCTVYAECDGDRFLPVRLGW